jgi:hypothetical protein
VFLIICSKQVINFSFSFKTFYILAKASGYETDHLLNICDGENHRPLHSSVIGKIYFLKDIIFSATFYKYRRKHRSSRDLSKERE